MVLDSYMCASIKMNFPLFVFDKNIKLSLLLSIFCDHGNGASYVLHVGLIYLYL